MTLAWLDTPSILTISRVDADLRDVLLRRLPKVMLTARTQPDLWLIYYPNRPVFGVSVTLTRRAYRLCFQHGGTDWSVWALSVIRAELGVIYNGECGDEGTDQTWTPDPEQWPTYESFVRDTHRREIEKNGNAIVSEILADVPQELRS